MTVYRVNNSDQLRFKLTTVKTGDEIDLQGKTFIGQFTSKIDGITIKNGIIKSNGEWGLKVDGDRTTVKGLDISGADGAGLWFFNNTGGKALYNKVHDNGNAGIYWLKCSELLAQHNILSDNGTSGMSVMTPKNFGKESDSGYDIRILDNIFYRNGDKNAENRTEKWQLILDGKPDGPVDETTTWKATYLGKTLVKGNKSYDTDANNDGDGSDFVAYYASKAHFENNTGDGEGEDFLFAFSDKLTATNNKGAGVRIIDTEGQAWNNKWGPVDNTLAQAHIEVPHEENIGVNAHEIDWFLS